MRFCFWTVVLSFVTVLDACRDKSEEILMSCDGVVRRVAAAHGRIAVECLSGDYAGFILTLHRDLPEGLYPRDEAVEVLVKEHEILPLGHVILVQRE